MLCLFDHTQKKNLECKKLSIGKQYFLSLLKIIIMVKIQTIEGKPQSNENAITPPADASFDVRWKRGERLGSCGGKHYRRSRYLKALYKLAGQKTPSYIFTAAFQTAPFPGVSTSTHIS